jgi:hypothetical protein
MFNLSINENYTKYMDYWAAELDTLYVQINLRLVSLIIVDKLRELFHKKCNNSFIRTKSYEYLISGGTLRMSHKFHSIPL